MHDPYKPFLADPIPTKETLILIPGFANNAHVWDASIEPLRSLYTTEIIVMDTQSSREEMVETLWKKAPPRFALAGHSMGGWIAQRAAAYAPERISKLVLLNTWATAKQERISWQKEMLKALKKGMIEEVWTSHLPLLTSQETWGNPTFMEILRQMSEGLSQEVFIRQLEAILADPSSLSYLPLITAPTLIVHSEEDALFSLEEAEILTTKIPAATCCILKGCGHASLIENPTAVSTLMRDFLLV